MPKYEKKRGFNLKGRAREWAESSTLLRSIAWADDFMDAGLYAKLKAKLTLAVYKLMREAYDHGFEAGYKEAQMNSGEDHAE